jgi:hypothetical protein
MSDHTMKNGAYVRMQIAITASFLRHHLNVFRLVNMHRLVLELGYQDLDKVG